MMLDKLIGIAVWSSSFLLLFWIISISESGFGSLGAPTYYYDRKTGRVKRR